MKTHHPPKIANRLLYWYCNKKYLEEIEGDIFELFSKRVDDDGLKIANRLYWWDVFRFFKWSNLKRDNKFFKNSNQTAMLKNYFKVGLRNILKYKLTSAINLVGLSITIGIAITFFIYLDWAFHMDSFHENAKSIYQVTNFTDRDGEVEQWGDTPNPLGPAMKSEIPQVIKSTRVNIASTIMRYEDQVFDETVHFVDTDFLEMFSFPFSNGNENDLNDKSSVIVTKEIAEKYFGNKDPIGKQITLTFDRRFRESFVVTALMEKLPPEASFGFDILVNYEKQRDIEIFSDQDKWENFTDATFIQVKDIISEEEIAPFFEKYIALQNEASDKWTMDSFHLQPLATLSLNSFDIRGSISFGNQPFGNYMIAIISIMLLLLACLNYMNISIVSAATRLKEIALRKVIGGRKGELVGQFLTENLILISISLLIGLSLAYYFLLPGLNSKFPFEIPFQFSSTAIAISFFGGILLFTALLSGAYPAFYISSFSPVNIFRGSEKFGRKSILSKALLTTQFFIAFLTIVAGFTFTDAAKYFKDKDWGYTQEAVLTLPMDGQEHYQKLKNILDQNSDIQQVSGAKYHIGSNNALTNISIDSKEHQVALFEVGFDYVETMGLRINSGRSFDENIESDKLETVLVNQSFADRMEWDDPLQKSFIYDSSRYHVIGVTEDFHYVNFYGELLPSFIKISSDDDFNFLVAKVNPGSVMRSRDLMEDTWKKVEPDLPYEGFIQNQVFDQFFQNLDANIELMSSVSIIALILSCMGLFGLVSFNINRRMKEFSIKKVLGANMITISKAINGDFIWLLVIAMILGAPLGYLSMDSLFELMFPAREPIGTTSFILGVLFVFITAFITVGTQIYRVAKSNPADNLRNE